MNKENPPTVENSPVEEALKVNMPEVIKKDSILERPLSEEQAMEKLKDEVLNNPETMETIAGTLDEKGKLFVPTTGSAETSKKKGFILKAAKFFGIATILGASSISAAHSQDHAKNQEKLSSNIENVTDLPKVSKELKMAWNQYVDFLEQKGLKGDPSLDHHDKSKKMINEFRASHPGTPLAIDSVATIQAYFLAFRPQRIAEIKELIKKGRATIEGNNPDAILKDLSKVDDIAGHETTMHKFNIDENITYYQDHSKKTKIEKHFATLANENTVEEIAKN